MGQTCPCGFEEIQFTMVENENKELIQTRLPTKIRVCIDYRKLNAATRKDHFSLSFIDQMLDIWLTTSITVSWTVTRGIIRFPLLWRTKKRQVHMSIWDICLSLNAFRHVQCPNIVPTLQLSLFSDMVEKFLEIFMDNFSIYKDSFDQFLHHLELVIQRCAKKKKSNVEPGRNAILW